MQTSGGQFGVPAPDVSPHYNSVNNAMNNTNSNTASITTPPTAGSTPSLGHMLFHFSPSHDQTAPLSSPPSTATHEHIPHSSHGQPLQQPPLLGNARSHDGGAAQESTPQTHTQQQQHHQQQAPQQNPLFSHFLHGTGAMSEQLQGAENAPQEQMVQHKQVNMEIGRVRAQAALCDESQSMQLHQQLSLGLDQAMASNVTSTKASENQQNSTDPISMDMDQAEEAGGAGNRWPRQETLALLKIRADMDASFRDSSVKRPLWDEVSRKLGELGYDRSAKKCKEKFENVNKYYKRTKEGKVGRQDGKNYRFFTQLEALSTNHHHHHNNNNNNNNNSINNDNTNNNNPLFNINHSNFSTLTPSSMLISNSIASTSDSITKFKAAAASDPSFPAVLAAPSTDQSGRAAEMLLFANSAVPSSLPAQLLSFDPIIFRPPVTAENTCNTLQFSSPSSSNGADQDEDDDDDDDDGDDDDDDEKEDGNPSNDMGNPTPCSDLPVNPAVSTVSKKRKRKPSTSLMAFFENLIKKVIEKQEQMQQKFLQALERRESDRMIREEAWRRQEMVRLSKESELRAQERSSAAVRDAALISFLQKATGQTVDLPAMSTSVVIAAQPVQCAPPLHQETLMQQYDEQDPSDPNNRRWLKPEVLALIDLHSSLQAKFTEVGPKGHLWEEIANGMAKLGYSSRTAKRCKEKWENINKYFKRAKESTKKRPENAKTCPYFHELDALYRKGVLRSSNANQLLYKPSIEHAQRRSDDDGVVRQPSSTSIVTGEGADIAPGVDALQAHPLCTRPSGSALPLDEMTPVTNSSGGGDVNDSMMSDVGIRNMNDSNGGLQSQGTSMLHLSSDTLRSAPMSMSILEDDPSRSARTSGLMPELGLTSQQQSAAIMDLYQHKKMNESELGIGNAGEHERQAQSGKQESKPVVLAPLPNSSSFMSSLLQKMNSGSNSVT